MRPFNPRATLALVLLALAAGCPRTDLPPEGETSWDCSDGADNDFDGGFDCDDAGCSWWEGCFGTSDLDDTGDDDTSEEEIVDADGDGSPAGEDCDDLNPNVHPGAEEICDGLDTNCDNVVDPEDWDRDGDGLSQCQGDCDDTRPDIYPGALEVCDGADGDCDGVADPDGDGDSFFDCEDCDPANPDVYPTAPELCNGRDDNCNGLVDEGFPTDEYWLDEDGDGFGDEYYPVPLEVCFDPGLPWSRNHEDCDDARWDTHPGAPEFCNGLDDDCDGEVDTDAIDRIMIYFDVDGDSHAFDYSSATSTICAMEELPPGYYFSADDCNDGDPLVHPDAAELCDSIDNNCNDLVDEGCPDLGELIVIQATEIMPGTRASYAGYHRAPGDQIFMVADCVHFAGTPGDFATFEDITYEVTTNDGTDAEDYLSWCQLTGSEEDDFDGLFFPLEYRGVIDGSELTFEHPFDYPVEIPAGGNLCLRITCEMGTTDKTVGLTTRLDGVNNPHDSVGREVPVNLDFQMNGGPWWTHITVYLDPS